MLPHFVLRCISQLSTILAFDILLKPFVKAPWAKVARRCHRLLLTAGVGNTQSGEEKPEGHIFSVENLLQAATVYIFIDPVLRCIWEEKVKYLSSVALLVYLNSLILFRYQDLYSSITFEPINYIIIEPLRTLWT